MSVLLANPALLPLLAIAALPVLLHLFSLTKPKTYRFSSIELLEKIAKKTRRIRKPQDILLLITRTLLLAALAFMFLQPLLFSDRRLSSMTTSRDIVIILDTSASMAYLERGQTRFASACAEASELLRSLSLMDKSNIIYMKSRPEAIFPETGSNVAYMRENLRRASVSSENGNVEAAIRMAVEMLSDTREGIKEICVISDFQKTQWKDSVKLDIPDSIILTFIKVGGETGGNQAVTRVSTSPSFPLLGEDISFHGELRNFSPSPERVNVFFRSGEVHESTSLVIPAWGSATATFSAGGGIFERHESVSGADDIVAEGRWLRQNPVIPYEFSIGEDSFFEDNRRWGLLKVAERLRVGIVEYSPDPAESWRRSLSLFPWIELTAEHPGSISPNEEYDFLLLSGWDGSNLPEIKRLLIMGVAVVCAPAAGLPLSSLQSLVSPGEGESTATVLEENSTNQNPFRMKIINDKHKLFSLFSSGEHGDPVGALVLSRLRLPERIFSSQDMIISYSDGVPALLHGGLAENRKLFVWNIPLASTRSNFARRVQFVPFMAEFILSAPLPGEDLSHLADYFPGESILCTPNFPFSAGDIELIGSEQTPLSFSISKLNTGIAPSAIAPLSLVSSPISRTGVYSWISGNGLISSNVVNFPIQESDFRSIAISTLGKRGTPALAGAGNVSSMRNGKMLWPWLLAFAVILLLAEGLLTLWAGKMSQTP